jgi:hypothetical protein
VQDEIDPSAGRQASVQISYVSFNKCEPGPLLRLHQPAHFFEVLSPAGGKVIEAYNALVEQQQSFQQIRTDKSGNSGD